MPEVLKPPPVKEVNDKKAEIEQQRKQTHLRRRRLWM